MKTWGAFFSLSTDTSSSAKKGTPLFSSHQQNASNFQSLLDRSWDFRDNKGSLFRPSLLTLLLLVVFLALQLPQCALGGFFHLTVRAFWQFSQHTQHAIFLLYALLNLKWDRKESGCSFRLRRRLWGIATNVSFSWHENTTCHQLATLFWLYSASWSMQPLLYPGVESKRPCGLRSSSLLVFVRVLHHQNEEGQSSRLNSLWSTATHCFWGGWRPPKGNRRRHTLLSFSVPKNRFAPRKNQQNQTETTKYKQTTNKSLRNQLSFCTFFLLLSLTAIRPKPSHSSVGAKPLWRRFLLCSAFFKHVQMKGIAPENFRSDIFGFFAGWIVLIFNSSVQTISKWKEPYQSQEPRCPTPPQERTGIRYLEISGNRHPIPNRPSPP